MPILFMWIVRFSSFHHSFDQVFRDPRSELTAYNQYDLSIDTRIRISDPRARSTVSTCEDTYRAITLTHFDSFIRTTSSPAVHPTYPSTRNQHHNRYIPYSQKHLGVSSPDPNQWSAFCTSFIPTPPASHIIISLPHPSYWHPPPL